MSQKGLSFSSKMLRSHIYTEKAGYENDPDYISYQASRRNSFQIDSNMQEDSPCSSSKSNFGSSKSALGSSKSLQGVNSPTQMNDIPSTSSKSTCSCSSTSALGSSKSNFGSSKSLEFNDFRQLNSSDEDDQNVHDSSSGPMDMQKLRHHLQKAGSRRSMFGRTNSFLGNLA